MKKIDPTQSLVDDIDKKALGYNIEIEASILETMDDILEKLRYLRSALNTCNKVSIIYTIDRSDFDE
jgi:hypothetical protein